MGAYKSFKSQDIIVSPLEVSKNFTFSSSIALTASNIGINRFKGINDNSLTNFSTTGQTITLSQVGLYNSIKQLYYTNYLSGSYGDVSNVSTASFNPDGTLTGEFYSPLYDNYLDTTLNPGRYFPTASQSTIGVMSIPKDYYGDTLKPYSLSIVTESGSYTDNGEGVLHLSTAQGPINVGNVIYPHGLIILTGGNLQDSLSGSSGYSYTKTNPSSTFNSGYIDDFISSSAIQLSFSSSYTIYETQYKCTINSDEFTYSQHPTLLSGSDGDYYDFATGSYFAPYVTTIGLYDDAYNLIAVGKLAQPLQTSRTTDTTILINIDR